MWIPCESLFLHVKTSTLIFAYSLHFLSMLHCNAQNYWSVFRWLQMNNVDHVIRSRLAKRSSILVLEETFELGLISWLAGWFKAERYLQSSSRVHQASISRLPSYENRFSKLLDANRWCSKTAIKFLQWGVQCQKLLENTGYPKVRRLKALNISNQGYEHLLWIV